VLTRCAERKSFFTERTNVENLILYPLPDTLPSSFPTNRISDSHYQLTCNTLVSMKYKRASLVCAGLLLSKIAKVAAEHFSSNDLLVVKEEKYH